MAHLRREHEELARLIESIGSHADTCRRDGLELAEALALRRLIIELYALVKIHIGEEEEYLRVLEGNLSESEQESVGAGLQHATAES